MKIALCLLISLPLTLGSALAQVPSSEQIIANCNLQEGQLLTQLATNQQQIIQLKAQLTDLTAKAKKSETKPATPSSPPSP